MIRHPLPRRAAATLTAAVAATLALTLAAGASSAPPPEPNPISPRADVDRDQVGRWSVVRTGRESWLVSWRSPERLPITSDRPAIVAGGARLGVSTVRRDGRTVVTTVRAASRPDPAGLDVVHSGDRLDEPGTDVSRASARPLSPRRIARLADDPAEPGSFDVVSSDYQLDPVKLPRMREPIEMVGHVVEPESSAATGPRPLVLFLHGRHSFCYHPDGGEGDDWAWPCQPPMEEIPSHLGYDYIQRVLASQGFTTVSVRVNGINAQDWRLDDGGADARAEIVQRHLDHWATIADTHRTNLSRVVLVGHSRGGEGVNRASIQVPLTASHRIVGQVLLAPTNFGTQTAPYVPTTTVLPYCDGDVFDLQGQRFTDSARDLATDDTSLKSSVLVMGANHNFFNTEWTPGIAQAPSWDDWWGGGERTVCGTDAPTRLTAGEQRAVGVAYVAGAAQLFAQDAEEFLPLFDGSVVRPVSIGAADVFSHAIGGGRELRRPVIDAGLSLAAGADTSFCQGVVKQGSQGACGRLDDLYGQAPHWYFAGEFAPPRRELELTWSEAGQTGGLVFDHPLDLSDAARLELRTIVDPTRGDVRIRLRLTDGSGASAILTPEGDGLVRALPVDRFVGRRWAQAVIADPADADGIDLSSITRLDLVGDSADGRVWLLDVAAAPASLAAVPGRRMPTVSFGTLRIDEGDEAEPQTARVPFTVQGTLTERASLVVGVVDTMSYRNRERLRVDLAPGQTSGSIAIEYQPNTVDDYRLRTTLLDAHPLDGVMTDAYLGALRIVDDDPRPRVRITTPARVREGKPVTAKVTLSSAAGYDSWYGVRVVRGEGRGTRLAVGDVPARWLKRHGVPSRVAASKPLHRVGLFLFARIRSGRTTASVSIPTRSDAVREGRERVSLQVLGDGVRTTRTVRVAD